MDDVEGARTFAVAGQAYDSFMSRYSVALGEPFADAAGVSVGDTALDVGCGPGALTGVLVSRLGSNAVYACDPSPPFRHACAARHPDVLVKLGRAESIPFEDHIVDHALRSWCCTSSSTHDKLSTEMARVVRPGGSVAACVWHFADGMEMLRRF